MKACWARCLGEAWLDVPKKAENLELRKVQFPDTCRNTVEGVRRMSRKPGSSWWAETGNATVRFSSSSAHFACKIMSHYLPLYLHHFCTKLYHADMHLYACQFMTMAILICAYWLSAGKFRHIASLYHGDNAAECYTFFSFLLRKHTNVTVWYSFLTSKVWNYAWCRTFFSRLPAK